MTELLKINVNDHTERKNGLTYLSWAWAWAEVLKLDPKARWHAVEYSNERGNAVPCMFLPDGSAMVKTEVTIKGETKTCMLPVMNHRNQAIKNPDAFAINTAIMRCMTKAISMHGLGLYIYAGEDLPESDEPKQEQPKAEEKPKRGGVVKDVLQESPALEPAVEQWLVEFSYQVIETFREGGAPAAFDAIEQAKLDDIQKIFLWNNLPSDVRSPIKKHSLSLHQKAAA